MSDTRFHSIEKLQTGIPGFDHVSAGGIPKGRTCLISGTAGSSKTVFACQFLIEGLNRLQQGLMKFPGEEGPRDAVVSLDLNYEVVEG